MWQTLQSCCQSLWLHWSTAHCSSMPLPFLYRGPRTRPHTPGVSYQCWVEVKDHALPTGKALANRAEVAVCLVCCKGTVLAHVQPGDPVPRITRAFSVKQFSSWLELASTGVWGYPSPGAGVRVFLCWTWWGSSAHFSSLSRHLWVAAWPSGISAPSPSVASFQNSVRIFLVPSSRLLMNKFKNIVPTTWGTPLMFGFQLWTCQVRRLHSF